MNRLAGKCVVITGGGRGIGRAMALANAAAGAHVVVVARTATEVEATAQAVRDEGGAATAVTLDVLDLRAVEAAFARIALEVGPIDILINNAGVFSAIGPIWEVDPDSWWRDVEVSVRGTFNTCRAVLPSMRARRSGRIINLIGGGTGGNFPMGSGYASAKSGIMRLTECVAATVRDDGITVMAMAPGLVRTAMTEWQLTSPEGRKYLGVVAQRFAEGDNLPPERAAELSVEIGAGRFDALTGRAVSAYDDFDAVAARMDEYVANDCRVLRMPGFGPTLKPLNE